jgi:deoxyadenosine/deoxycytidine kinase
MTNHLISVMGTLGIGKTTYSTLLADRLAYSLVTENYSENPFLPKFYDDMNRWAFHSQSFFLLEKAKQLEEISVQLEGTGVVQDTPIFQDVYSYALAQHKLGNMDEHEWSLYTKLYNGIVNHLPQPSLIIYLDASTGTIMKRIEERGRSYEQSIPLEYIELLHELNKTLIDAHKHIPTLFIDANSVDIVNSESDKEQVLSMVKQALYNKPASIQNTFA